MANIVITNNGNPSDIPATYDEQGNELTPFIPADTQTLKITDALGVVRFLSVGQCSGFAMSNLMIEVV